MCNKEESLFTILASLASNQNFAKNVCMSSISTFATQKVLKAKFLLEYYSQKAKTFKR